MPEPTVTITSGGQYDTSTSFDTDPTLNRDILRAILIDAGYEERVGREASGYTLIDTGDRIVISFSLPQSERDIVDAAVGKLLRDRGFKARLVRDRDGYTHVSVKRDTAG